MNYYNMPADFLVSTIEKYDQLNQAFQNSKVIETYGQINKDIEITNSGRPGDLLPKTDWLILENYVKASKKYGIKFNYTLNATCMSNIEFTDQGLAQIIFTLKRLYELGIESITVTIPSLIEIVRSTSYPFEIKASTLCQITNLNKATAFLKLGVDRMVLDESINRDIDTVKQIRRNVGNKVELIANAICHRNCIYRPFHLNQCAHDSSSDTPSSKFYTHRCMQQRLSSLGDILRLGWIRPEDIKLYNQIGIEYFKIQGRHIVQNGDPVKTVEAYMKENFDGNLLELLDLFYPTNSFKIYLDNKKLEGFINPYFKNNNFCKYDCDNCNYCDNFIKKCIDIEDTEIVRKRALVYYQAFDPITQSISKFQENYESSEKNENTETYEEFNFQ